MAIKLNLAQRINLILKALDKQREVKLKSGHTLVIAEGHEEPGFKVESIDGEELVINIGTDVAWMFLIEHARNMTQDEAMSLVWSTCDLKLPGKYI